MLALALALGTVKKARGLGSPDFKVFYTAAQHALHDPENIYRLSPDRYLYPPSTALLLTPFAFSTHYEVHQWIWHGLLGLLVFALSAVSGPALAAMALLTRYLAITLSYGQINLVVLGLFALTGILARRGSLRPAGSVWALVTSLKVYPVVLAPFFFPRPRWRAFGGAMLGGALLLFLPFAFFGLDTGSQLYADFFEALRAKGLPLHSHNQSIAALLLRLFTKQMFYLHAIGPAWWGVADLPEPFLRVCALVIGGALSYFSWRRAAARGLGAEAALSAASFSILFLSHIVWRDYLLLLYFPLREGFALWDRRKSWWVAGSFLAVITLSSPDVLQLFFAPLGAGFAHYMLTETPTIGHALSVRLDGACIHLWAAGLVWVAWWKA
ncbi:MAG: glycosyltransferase family 87 protein [Bdellovibrionota bacterium]